MAPEEGILAREIKLKNSSGDKSKKLLKMTVSSSSYDFRQSMLALLMVLFFAGCLQKLCATADLILLNFTNLNQVDTLTSVSSMSLVWTFSVIVPYIRGRSYVNRTCQLVKVRCEWT